MSVIEQLVPVGTLVLGAGLTQVQANWGTSRAARAEARLVLAEVSVQVWKKQASDDWVLLQAFGGRLRSHLRAAGVPPEMVAELLRVMNEFWRSVEYDAEEGDYSVSDAPTIDLDAATEVVWLLLDDSQRQRRFGRKIFASWQRDRAER